MIFKTIAALTEMSVADGLLVAQRMADRDRKRVTIFFEMRTDTGFERLARYECDPFQKPEARDPDVPVLPTGRDIRWLIK